MKALHREQVRRFYKRNAIELPADCDQVDLAATIERHRKKALPWEAIGENVRKAFGLELTADQVCRLHLADPAKAGGWTGRVTA